MTLVIKGRRDLPGSPSLGLTALGLWERVAAQALHGWWETSESSAASLGYLHRRKL